MADESGAPAVEAVGAKRRRPAALDPEELAKFKDVEHRKGVVYLSRIPPYMKPVKIAQLLEKYGELGRVYLAPEDPAAYKRRIKGGGNKKQVFVEGWVEFADKRVARQTAALLNTTPVEPGKNHGFYATDLWTIKYLKHFKWHHLTEKIAYEQRIRASKLRAQLSAARKDSEAYLERVDQAKAIREMEAKKARKRGAAGGAASAAAGSTAGASGGVGIGGDSGGGGSGGGGGGSGGDSGGGGSGGGSGGSGGARDTADDSGEREQIRRRFKQRKPIMG